VQRIDYRTLYGHARGVKGFVTRGFHTSIITCGPSGGFHIFPHKVKSCPKFVVGTLDTNSSLFQRKKPHGWEKQPRIFSHRLYSSLTDWLYPFDRTLYMSQHFSVKNDSKLNSFYLNLTVFSIVSYQWKIIVNNVIMIIDLLLLPRYTQI